MKDILLMLLALLTNIYVREEICMLPCRFNAWLDSDYVLLALLIYIFASEDMRTYPVLQRFA